MNTPMTPQDSINRPVSALLRDAQALVATATAQALRDAGSSPREFRLLERLSRMSEINNTDRIRHVNRRLDVKVARPGSVAATFAARGWIAYIDRAWRLTPAGEAERARLTEVMAVPGTDDPSVREALAVLIDTLGGADAARSARRAQRNIMRERIATRHGGHGKRHMRGRHPFGQRGEHRDHHPHDGHPGRAGYDGHHGHPGRPFRGDHDRAFQPERPGAHGCERNHGEHPRHNHPHGMHPRGRGSGHSPERHRGGAPDHQH